MVATTVSIKKEVLELLDPFCVITDVVTGIQTKITRTALVEAIIIKWIEDKKTNGEE